MRFLTPPDMISQYSLKKAPKTISNKKLFKSFFFRVYVSINIMTRKWHKGLFRALNDPAESYC